MEDGVTTQRAWPIWMAVAGLGLMGLESVLIAPASAALAESVTGGTWLGLESVLTQILLVSGIVTIMAFGLLRRSWAAYLVVLLIGFVPFAVWVFLLASNDPLALHRTAVRLVAASLFVLAGLGLGWPLFSQTTGSDEP